MVLTSSEPVEIVEGMPAQIAGARFRIDRLIGHPDDRELVAVLVASREGDVGASPTSTSSRQASGERYSHVDDDVQPLLWGSAAERSERFHSSGAALAPWISRATQRHLMERLLRLTERAGASGSPRLVVVGPGGAGKTAAACRFRDERNATAAAAGATVPVVYVRPWLSTQDFYEKCLDAAVARDGVYSSKALRRPGMKNADRLRIVEDAFREVDVRTLILGNLYGYSSPSSSYVRPRVEMLDTFADGLDLVVACLQELPLSLPGSWSSPWRGAEVVHLTPCRLDAEFRDALATFEKRIPLRLPSELDRSDMAGRLHARSEGHLGVLWHDLVRLLDEALATESERIDHELIDRAEHEDREERRLDEEREDPWLEP